jgi:hypothetical protein
LVEALDSDDPQFADTLYGSLEQRYAECRG